MLTRLNDDLEVISKLSDLPNDTDGLDSGQLKAKFDEAALMIKTYINTILLPALESSTVGASGSRNIGSDTIAGLTGATVYDQLVSLKTAIDGVVVGAIPDGSIPKAKLSFSAAETSDVTALEGKVNNKLLNLKRTLSMGGMV